MKSLSIGRKFTLTCLALLALTGALAGVSIYSITSINKDLLRIATDAVPGVRDASALKAELLEYRGNLLKHIASSSQSEMDKIESDNAQLHHDFLESLKDYEAAITQAEDRAGYEKFRPAFDRFEQAWLQVLPISRAGKNTEAYDKCVADVTPRYLELRELLKERVDWNLRYLETAQKKALATTNRGLFVAWLLTAICFGAGALLTFLIVRSVNAALGRAASELADNAEQLASAASQVSSSSQSLAQGASQQAASLEETSASSEQINSMARKNTENSRAAADLVSSSQRKFSEANQSLEQSVAAMAEINAQSGKISKIIKIIEEIAFQTNILALNAAVEAARAGEAGMGFAVVADEVRNLAHRSSQAARDTAALIEESISKSADGKTKVDQVAAAIQAISGEASQVKMLVDEMKLGSQEQSRGIEHVAEALTQVEQVTQTTAANAEESAAAAEELTAQSAVLKDIVERLSAMVGSQTRLPIHRRCASKEMEWRSPDARRRRNEVVPPPPLGQTAVGRFACR